MMMYMYKIAVFNGKYLNYLKKLVGYTNLLWMFVCIFVHVQACVLKNIFFPLHILLGQSLLNITKTNYLNPCSHWNPIHTHWGRKLKKKKRKKGSKTRKQRQRWTVSKRGREKEDGKEGDTERARQVWRKRWRRRSFGVHWGVRQVHSHWTKHCVPLCISALTQAANTVATDSKLTSQLHYSAGGVYRPATPKGPRRPAKNINCF